MAGQGVKAGDKIVRSSLLSYESGVLITSTLSDLQDCLHYLPHFNHQGYQLPMR